MGKRNIVVGAGFTGAVVAERIASQQGLRVLLIDRRPHLGGNAYDHFDDAGVFIHRYGPHIFHTNAARVVEYLSQFTAWRPYEHRVRAWVDGQFVPVPFNFKSMEMVFGKQEGARLKKLLVDEFGLEVKVPILKMRQSQSADVRRVADVIYEKIFLHYTIKQWGLLPEELDASVSARVPVHLSHDDRYFQDSFQHMPAEGYTALFARLLDHPLIEVRLGVRFEDIAGSESFDRVIFTGPIDEFFGHRYGALPYRSFRFEHETVPAVRTVQQAAVENYPTPSSQHAYTRKTEYRQLTGQSDVEYTTRSSEYPEAYVPGMNEPYYPIPREENREIFRKYAADAAKLASVVFAGRLADYSYYNMDQAVARALTCFEREIVTPLVCP